MTDISTIQAKLKTLEIVHPASEEKIGLRIVVRPDSHPDVKKAQRKNLDAQLGSRKSKLSAAQVDRNTMALLVAAVDSWEWYGEDTNFEGQKPDCTPENVESVFKKAPWIKDQVREEFDDSQGFFEA